MTRHPRLWLFVLTALLAAGGASCRPPFLRPPYEPAPIVFQTRPTLGQIIEYVNSGTWTEIYVVRSEDRDFWKESKRAYVQVDRKDRKVELLRWRDDLCEGKPFSLFRKRKRTLGSGQLTLLFLLGALLVSVGDWFHVRTDTIFYPPEVYGWYIGKIPFFIPIIFGLAAAFFGIAYEQSNKLFGTKHFREAARISHVLLAGLLYMVVHVSSGYVGHWPFGLPHLVLGLPVCLIWYFLDRSLCGACFCVFAGLTGMGAEILLVQKGIFSFSDKVHIFCGVATWLPWIYAAGAFAVGRFVERSLTYET